jgi:hypothetical protein
VSPVVLAVSVGIGSASETRLAGRVVGPSGTGIEGATVYVLGAGPRSVLLLAAAPEIEVIASGADGEFAAAVPSGRYRVAASKPGYDVTLTEVNTLARPRLELRLRRASRLILGDLPAGSEAGDRVIDWVLRRPSGDVLRDQEAGLAPPSGEEAGAAGGGAGADETGTGGPAAGGAALAAQGSARPAARLLALMQPLQGEFGHRFSGAGLLGGDPGAGGSSGRSTTLALRGPLGGQGTWRFDGQSGRSHAAFTDGGGARQGRRADRMELGMDYRLGPEDDLKAEFRYDTGRYAVDLDGATVNATDQEQRTVGFRSRWDRRLRGSALLYVDGAYFETGVTTPGDGRSPFAALAGDPSGRDRVTDRSWLATSGLTFRAGNHALDFGLRTKKYRYELRDRGVLLYSLEDAPTLTEPGERGNAMSLYGDDDWRLAERAVLSYGLRYHSNLSLGHAYFVPRVGMTLEPAGPGGTRIRSMMMVRLDDPGLSSLYSTAADRRSPEPRDVGRLGYALGIERRPDDRLHVKATLSYTPFEEGFGGDATRDPAPMAAWGDALLLLSDGAAGRHALEVELGRRFGPLRGTLAGSVGRVEGRLTPAFEEAPVQILSMGEARYLLTRLRAEYAPTDTEVQIDYRRVEGGHAPAGASFDGGALDYRRFDVVVFQDLSRLASTANARLRVLLAYQGLLYGSLYDGPGGTAASGTTSRVSGGVDIRF